MPAFHDTQYDKRSLFPEKMFGILFLAVWIIIVVIVIINVIRERLKGDNS